MSEEKKEEGAVASVLHDPLWKSWVGKLLALVALWWVTPMDKVLEQAILPAIDNLESVRKMAWTKGLKLHQWIRKYAYKTLSFSLGLGGLCLFVMAIGVHRVNPYLVAIGGGLWSLYVLMAWFIARSTLSPLMELAENGINLAGSVLGRLLHMIGLVEPNKDPKTIGPAESNKDPKLTIDIKGTRKFLNDSFVLVVVSLVTTSLVTIVTYVSTSAPWWSCGALVIGGLVLSVNLSVGVLKNIDFKEGWELLHTWSYRIALLLFGFGLVAAVLPSVRGRVAGIRSGVDAWIANPQFQPSVAVLLVLPLLAIVVALILSVWYGTDAKKSQTFRLVAKLMLIPLFGMPAVLVALGMITPSDIATASSRIQTGIVSAVLPNKALKPPVGKMDGDLTVPRVPAVPSKTVPVPTAAPAPDLSGMSVDEILNSIK